MRDTTANVGMTPTSKNSMAASAVATKTSGRQFEMPKIEFSANLRELAKEVSPESGPTAAESVGGLLHHQPTPLRDKVHEPGSRKFGRESTA